MRKKVWFLEMESTPGEDAVNFVEMTIKDSQYHTNVVGKTVAGFERLTQIFIKKFCCE
jgi:hypothetical protein